VTLSLFPEAIVKRLLLTTLVVTSLAVSAWPQSPNTPWLPVGIQGELGPLSFLTEGSVNMLSGGVALQTAYDDNALLSDDKSLGNSSLLVQPNIAIQETRPRSLWTLNYGLGFTANQKLPERYDYAHNLNFNLQYRVSERLTVRLQDNFVNQTTTFENLNDRASVQGGNVLREPNESIITPLSRRMDNLADLDLIYQLGSGTIASASGSFNTLNFKNTAGSTAQLYDTQLWNANAGFWQRLLGSHWLGASYAVEEMVIKGPVDERTKINVVQLFYTFAPSSHTSLSFFVGPNHTTINDRFQYVIPPFVIPISITKEHWLVDGGMTFGWRGSRTSVTAKVVRHVSDGGGLTGAVRTHNGDVNLRRQLTAKLVANVGVLYGANNTLSRFYSNNSIRTISGTAGLERSVRDDFSVALYYARDHQNWEQVIGGSGSGYRAADRNRVSFSIFYHFNRPLGR